MHCHRCIYIYISIDKVTKFTGNALHESILCVLEWPLLYESIYISHTQKYRNLEYQKCNASSEMISDVSHGLCYIAVLHRDFSNKSTIIVIAAGAMCRQMI